MTQQLLYTGEEIITDTCYDQIVYNSGDHKNHYRGINEAL